MMSLFSIQANVTKRLDAIRRNFLWQGSEDNETVPCGQMGGTAGRSERGWTQYQRAENPKQKFDDEMVVEICLTKSIAMEGSNNRKIWHGG